MCLFLDLLFFSIEVHIYPFAEITQKVIINFDKFDKIQQLKTLCKQRIERDFLKQMNDNHRLH